MSSLASLLPAPKNTSNYNKPEPVKQIAYVGETHQKEVSTTIPTFTPPAYGKRLGWLPKKEEHFGGGGAFPELHVTQFPLGMGRKDKKTATISENNTLALVVNNEGQVQHDQIVRQGQRDGKIIYSKFTDLIEATPSNDANSLAKPTEEEEAKATAETREALERKLKVKIGSTHKSAPKTIQEAGQTQQDATFFRYTPANNTDETRIVRMVEAPVDPLEPSKFHNKKMPRKPPSPPVTVMHSPNKKLTKADLENWKIVPCVSNWKNPKGYTIPLDKRLAADGRGLQEVQINDQFATFSESLYIAERKARQEIEEKGKLQKMLLIKQNEEREEKLRQLAQKARHARIGGMNEEESDARKRMIEHHLSRSDDSPRGGNRTESEDEEEEDEEERKRRLYREKRAQEKEYERRREHKLRKKRNSRPEEDDDEDDGRDITEKVALGQVRATSTQDQVDSRLYNFASGLDSGFNDDDAYNLYDKPLTKGSSVNQIYRPTKESMDEYNGGDVDALMSSYNDRFVKTGGFKGSESGNTKQSSREGLGPVQFERERGDEEEIIERPKKSQPKESEEDAFGFGEFISDIGKGKKRTLDHIGQQGYMRANAGSASMDPDSYRDSKRKRIDFAPSK